MSNSFAVLNYCCFLKTFTATISFIGLVCFSTYAQYSGYTSINDLTAFKKQFATESVKVMSITCDFS